MGLNQRFAEMSKKIDSFQQMKIDRARNAANQIIHSDQFALSILATEEGKICVDNLVDTVARSISDPVADFTDVLSNRGFRKAEIRELVHRLYNTYCCGFENADQSQLTYEEMIKPVAQYCYLHQEIYGTLDPAMYRQV